MRIDQHLLDKQGGMMTDQGSKRSPFEKFATALLATTCLTVATGATASAGAIIVVEGVGGTPSDFPNSPAGYLLPLGTTEVSGSLAGESDNTDWFEFQGLTPGATFSLSAAYNPPGQEANASFIVTNSSLAPLGAPATVAGGGPITGTVPNDGNLLVGMGSGDGGQYEVNLSTNAADAPEPSTLMPVGLALAGLLAQRRRRKANS